MRHGQFFFGGGGMKSMNKKLLKHVFALYSLPIIFSKNFLACYARSIAFCPQLTNASMQCVLPTPFIYFFHFFGVIIPECQLPKFTENTHKIAQNCIWNVQKLFAGVKGWGEGWRKRGEDMTMGGPAQWLLGDRRPWKTEKVVNGFCRNFLEGYVGHGPETNEFNFGDDPHHYPDPGRTATIILCWLAFGLGLCCLSTSSYYKRAFWNKQCMLKTVLQLRRKYRDICEVYGISHIATWTIRGICNSGILPISNDNVDSFVSQLLCCLPH